MVRSTSRPSRSSATGDDRLDEHDGFAEERRLPRLTLAADRRRAVDGAVEHGKHRAPLAERVARAAADQRLDDAPVRGRGSTTRRQRSKSDTNGPAALALGDDLGGDALADVLDVPQPVENLALLLIAEAER